MASGIPDAVKVAATFPLSEGPPPPPELPIEKLSVAGCTVLVMPGPTGAMVELRSVGEDEIDGTLRAVRELLTDRGKSRAAWWVPESIEPRGPAALLRERGLRPYDEPPYEARFAAMARVEPTAPGPEDVEARLVATFDEYDAGARLADAVFEVDEEDRRAWEEQRRVAFELQMAGRSPARGFVALVDGEVVGAAAALLGRAGVNLNGGSVREDMRGRGVYRALVRARWDHAVERGTPALTVQAGRLSRPILEKLGFQIVAWEECLLDDLTSG